MRWRNKVNDNGEPMVDILGMDVLSTNPTPNPHPATSPTFSPTFSPSLKSKLYILL